MFCQRYPDGSRPFTNGAYLGGGDGLARWLLELLVFSMRPIISFYFFLGSHVAGRLVARLTLVIS